MEKIGFAFLSFYTEIWVTKKGWIEKEFYDVEENK